MPNTAYTESFAEIMSCPRERQLCIDILQAWNDHGLPDDFDNDGVKVAFNRDSGYVFLVNSEYQVAMLADDKLESWYTSPYEGREGFLSDLLEELEHDPSVWHSEDIEWLKDIAPNMDIDALISGE